MVVITKTFRIRLGCDNCGLCDWYSLPFRANFHAWQDNDTPSYYDGTGVDGEPTCRNCGLSYLTALQWTFDDLPTSILDFGTKTSEKASNVAQDGDDDLGCGAV